MRGTPSGSVSVSLHMEQFTVGQWLRQALCGLHGHESFLRFGPERLSLKCVSCGHESPGWDLTTTPSTRRVRDGQAHSVPLRRHFANSKRAA